jgi:hypothetical protein
VLHKPPCICSKTKAHSDILIPIFHFCKLVRSPRSIWYEQVTAQTSVCRCRLHMYMDCAAHLCRHVTAQQPPAGSSELNQQALPLGAKDTQIVWQVRQSAGLRLCWAFLLCVPVNERVTEHAVVTGCLSGWGSCPAFQFMWFMPESFEVLLLNRCPYWPATAVHVKDT